MAVLEERHRVHEWKLGISSAPQLMRSKESSSKGGLMLRPLTNTLVPLSSGGSPRSCSRRDLRHPGNQATASNFSSSSQLALAMEPSTQSYPTTHRPLAMACSTLMVRL